MALELVREWRSDRAELRAAYSNCVCAYSVCDSPAVTRTNLAVWYGRVPRTLGRNPEAMMDATGLYEIERSLWTNDPKVFHDSLRRDALLIFRETGVVTRNTAVAAMTEENRENRHWTEVRFSDQRVLSPTHDTRVLIYKATARWNDQQDRITVRCSSIYALHSDEWKLVFHQETPIAA